MARQLLVPQDFTSIQAAIDEASEGDTIQVDAGIYRENLEINKSLVLKASTAGAVTIISSPIKPGVLVRGSIQVHIEGIRFQAEVGEGVASTTPGKSGQSSPEGVVVLGILIQDRARVTLRNNSFRHYQGAIEVAEEAQAVIDSNKIYLTLPFSESHYGIGVSYAHAEIKDNVILLRSHGDPAIGISLMNAQATISNNLITGMHLEGVYALGSRGLLIKGNLIVHDRGGIFIQRLHPDDEKGTVIIERNELLGSKHSPGVTIADISVRIRGNVLRDNGIGLNVIDWRVDDDTLNVRIEDNLVSLNQKGIYVGITGAARITNNLVERNEELGIELGWNYMDVEITGNRIMLNGRGIALLTSECAPQEALMFGHFEGQIRGSGNELSNNDKGDLCPSDYPWPPDFIKNP